MVQEKREVTNWYTVKVQNNYEKIVADRIQLEMNRINKEIKIVIPKERTVSAKNGKKVFKDKMMYPGYIFVETLSIADLQYIVRGTTGATKVVEVTNSDGVKIPSRLRKDEVYSLLLAEEELVKPETSDLFVIGEHVRILTGAFENFIGEIDFLDIDANKVKVLVKIFGRATPVDLHFEDITKDILTK